MNIPVKGSEQVTKQLNEWYQAMLQQQLSKATNLKQEIDKNIDVLKQESNKMLQEKNLLYYFLLDFRYKTLVDRFSITKRSFDEIDSFKIPTDGFLSYYYHFCKAVYATILKDYKEAKKYYEKAEFFLKDVPDEIEQAEFQSKLALFYHNNNEPLLAVHYATISKDIFSKHQGYESNTASCENTIGMSCVSLKQFEQAEEHLNSALNLLQKNNEERLISFVRHNLGWLYANQNLSELAIRHLSEVTEKIPNHFKAVFLQAREYSKLSETNVSSILIEKGLKLCLEVENEEYTHHFNILKALNNNVTIEELKRVIVIGISYFKEENLSYYVEEYAEVMAARLYEMCDYKTSSEYFCLSLEARKTNVAKGALK
ncbi:tetratricopeptide repeat protein [Bacillus mycoides]|uniref:response regulator aspartate phosphatase n=1 Tax=Bacillus mycoides TaxID=1405 RepID=UPI001C022102|nr:tetratricopeptide repeat protein [Bacillus mycoides]QWG51481.1 tetratricopeptide repeat protein [Bacillus mycoides]QWG57088.1 tetratricopeptide repeat protein [Bacillus mycoides]QWG75130.1 tetratricopeptide repeat protein [Bacillus mycoides]QWH24097.1 tetratricopeptide repeat protein [Bacillus mycoides]QWH35284.1 tetratricopeptide repeat protein [Bacillus mycoides]